MKGKMFKTCSSCHETKDISDFVKNRSAKDGLSGWCKQCHCKSAKAWRQANPEKAKKSNRDQRLRDPMRDRRDMLRKKYGIDLDDYDSLLRYQDYKCAICGSLEADSMKKFLCVDHINGTTLIRGLLCSACNSAIGLLKHDPDILMSAISYLQKSPIMEGTKVGHGQRRDLLALRLEEESRDQLPL